MRMVDFFDFNTATELAAFNLIPDGTIAPMRMMILCGGHNDTEHGWTGGYATYSERTGAIYLNCDFRVIRGEYKGRGIRSLIGLFSQKGPTWGDMGRSFIKSILNSAYGLKAEDDSQRARDLRKISGFDELDGIEFLAQIGRELDRQEYRNVVKTAIQPGHRAYDELMPEPYVRKDVKNKLIDTVEYADKVSYKPWMI